MPEIAEAVHGEPGELVQTFHDHLQTTPSAYLERVRLERAHDELQIADPASSITVADIAVRWGFQPGRFATEYRRRFGWLPGATLLT